MWRNWKPGALFQGMQNGTAAMEKSMEFPQKIKKIEVPYGPTIPLLGVFPKELKAMS